MITLNEIRNVLDQTVGHLPFLIPFLLLSGVVAYFSGGAVKKRARNIIKLIFPLVAVELIIFLSMWHYLIRWIGIGSFSWGFYYEGGWDFYIPFTLMIGSLIGYPLGLKFRKGKG